MTEVKEEVGRTISFDFFFYTKCHHRNVIRVDVKQEEIGGGGGGRGVGGLSLENVIIDTSLEMTFKRRWEAVWWGVLPLQNVIIETSFEMTFKRRWGWWYFRCKTSS